MEIFGFEIKKAASEETNDKNIKTFTSAVKDDGALEVATGGSYGTYIDLEGSTKSEADLVSKYRQLAMGPEFDNAIDDICNEAIVLDDMKSVDINLDDLDQPKNVKDKIKEEFDIILKLLDFNKNGFDIFKQWYIDGRLYYHIMIDLKKPRQGIKELRKLDPRTIKKVREVIHEIDPKTKVKIEKGINEYYMYFPKGIKDNPIGIHSLQAIKIAKDSICHVTSGIMDINNKLVLSHIHKAMKAYNQLKMLEDATVIYRLARAPERRIFYIDVGNLPKLKAEQYLADMMHKHKNKLVYDASTGEIRDDRKYMTMLEDFWLPRREGGRSTEITTLPGGQNLGEMEDVNYFRRNLYRALNVPITRIESENQFNLGRSSEITRDELKFNKFISRLRSRFSHLFNDLLEIQVILKGIANRNQWKIIKEDIIYNFAHDNHFSELKEMEIFRERIAVAGEADGFVGRYISESYMKKKIFRLTDEQIAEMDKEIKADRANADSAINQIPQDEAEDQPAKQPAKSAEKTQSTKKTDVEK